MRSVHSSPSIKDLKSHQKSQKKISIQKFSEEEMCSPLKPNTYTYEGRKLNNNFLAKMNPSCCRVPQISTQLLFQMLQPWMKPITKLSTTGPRTPSFIPILPLQRWSLLARKRPTWNPDRWPCLAASFNIVSRISTSKMNVKKKVDPPTLIL